MEETKLSQNLIFRFREKNMKPRKFLRAKMSDNKVKKSVLTALRMKTVCSV